MSLHLSPRHKAMLAEMGIRLWLPPQPEAPQPAPAPAPASAPASAPSPTQPQRPSARAQAHAAPTPADSPAATPAVAPGAHAAAVAHLDWPALEAAVARCRACGLADSRTQTVFGAGDPQAPWMVVGEAPGQQEDLQGQPFVGPAGQLLDAMLAAIGLSRHAAAPAPADRTAQGGPATARHGSVYIANVLKCRPPANRNPLPQEVAQCEPYLRRQVALVRPRIILAMGRFAVQSLLNTEEPLGRLRGRAHDYHGVPLIVTYHPAYLLRNPAEKAKAWQDLCLALSLAQDSGSR